MIKYGPEADGTGIAGGLRTLSDRVDRIEGTRRLCTGGKGGTQRGTPGYSGLRPENRLRL
jgi:hypothetical protein